MIQYTKKTDALGNEYIEGVDGDSLIIIPIDPANSDYQRYLNPQAEQSTPILS